MTETLQIVIDNRVQLLRGLGVTIALCAIIWTAGCALGIAAGVLSARHPKVVGRSIAALSLVVSATPAIVLMLWLHYPAQSALGVVVSPFATAAFALTLINALLVGEVVRDHVAEFPQQFIWAAKVAGVPRNALLFRIVLPMLTRMLLPKLLSIQIAMLQATIFASLISVDELFRACLRINSVIHKPVEVFAALAIFFVSVCLPLHLLTVWLRSKFVSVSSER